MRGYAKGYATESGSDEEQKPKKFNKKGKRKPKIPIEMPEEMKETEMKEIEKIPLFTFVLKDEFKEQTPTFDLANFSFPKQNINFFNSDKVAETIVEEPVTKYNFDTMPVNAPLVIDDIPFVPLVTDDIPFVPLVSKSIGSLPPLEDKFKTLSNRLDVLDDNNNMMFVQILAKLSQQELAQQLFSQKLLDSLQEDQKHLDQQIVEQRKFDQQLLDQQKLKRCNVDFKSYFLITGGLICYSIFIFHELQLYNFF